MPEHRRAGVATEGLDAGTQWGPAGAARPWTVGVEEELMLLDPRRWSLANRIDDVVAVLAPALRSRVSAETHACVAELKSGIHPTVAGLGKELTALRSALHATLVDRLGLRAAAAGTHPLATRSEVGVSSGARYREIDTTMRALAHREPTMALHVHVAIPDGPTAVRALDGLRGDLPVLLALSANSPFWHGSDSGFASIRTPVFSMFPRVGIPRHFGTYERYVWVVQRMVDSQVVPEPGFLWWDVRLQPRLATLEVRILDAQSRVADVTALAALVQCLVRRHAEGPPESPAEPEILAENRFLAARDGMDATLVDRVTGRRRPVAHLLDELLDACRPFAAALGCVRELAGAAVLAADPGYARQRRLAARDGIGALPALLSAELAAAPLSPVAA